MGVVQASSELRAPGEAGRSSISRPEQTPRPRGGGVCISSRADAHGWGNIRYPQRFCERAAPVEKAFTEGILSRHPRRPLV